MPSAPSVVKKLDKRGLFSYNAPMDTDTPTPRTPPPTPPDLDEIKALLGRQAQILDTIFIKLSDEHGAIHWKYPLAFKAQDNCLRTLRTYLSLNEKANEKPEKS